MAEFNYESLALIKAMPQLTDTQTQAPFPDEGSFKAQSTQNLRWTKLDHFTTNQINLSNRSIKTEGKYVS
jgi:hypothetical protein